MAMAAVANPSATRKGTATEALARYVTRKDAAADFMS
jgi:hypothetical protein